MMYKNPLKVSYEFLKLRQQFLIQQCEDIQKRSLAFECLYYIIIDMILNPGKVSENSIIEFAEKAGIEYSADLRENIKDYFCKFRNTLFIDFTNIHSLYFDVHTLVLEDDLTPEEKANVMLCKQQATRVYKETVDIFMNHVLVDKKS